MSLFKLIFGSKNDRYLKKLRPIVREINALEPVSYTHLTLPTIA